MTSAFRFQSEVITEQWMPPGVHPSPEHRVQNQNISIGSLSVTNPGLLKLQLQFIIQHAGADAKGGVHQLFPHDSLGLQVMTLLADDLQDVLISIRIHVNVSLMIQHLTNHDRAFDLLKLQVVYVVYTLASADMVHENQPGHFLHGLIGVLP